MPNGPMTNTIHRRFLGQLGNGVAAYQPWISRRLNTALPKYPCFPSQNANGSSGTSLVHQPAPDAIEPSPPSNEETNVRKHSPSQLDDHKEKGADAMELDVTAPLAELMIIARKLGPLRRICLQPARVYVLESGITERRTGTVVWMGSLGGWIYR
ncbi:hypothetical protein Moror_2831 [Moniliophthora roreri MCA 2997]|uniref:Uncharacterized protein n=1 Tax=Moniliophthora roreri (strain MCA 2997) TaxID=1381753 RepID=V2XEM4_MONRO|nr:hypothetical protein Moror_2831 [Moniliophthora roreri MCA 2997]